MKLKMLLLVIGLLFFNTLLMAQTSPVAVLDSYYDYNGIVIDCSGSYDTNSGGSLDNYIWAVSSYYYGQSTAAITNTYEYSSNSEFDLANLSSEYDIYTVCLSVENDNGLVSTDNPQIVLFNNAYLAGMTLNDAELFFNASNTLGAGYGDRYDVSIKTFTYETSDTIDQDIIKAVSLGNYSLNGYGVGITISRGDFDWSTIAGEGTSESPWQIDSVDKLLAIDYFWEYYDDYFILTSDLDFTGISLSKAVIASDRCVAPGFQGKSFSGEFDGGGYNIENLIIVSDEGSDFTGLFGSLAGSVSNLDLSGIIIANTSASSVISSTLVAELKGDPVLATGVDGGNCLQFDGVDDFVEINDTAVDVSDDFSILVWVKDDSGENDGVFSGNTLNRVILQQYNGSVDDGDTLLYRSPNGVISSMIDGVGTASTGYILPANQWVLLGLTYGDGDVKLYADGNLVGISSNVSLDYWDGGFRVGAYRDEPGADIWDIAKSWSGGIDNLDFYNKELTASDILAYMGSAIEMSARYEFESSSTFATDSTVNDYDGTAYGTPSEYVDLDLGNCISFDGVDDYIDMSECPIDVTDDFTFSLWLNVQQEITAGTIILQQLDGTDSNSGKTILGIMSGGQFGTFFNGGVASDEAVFAEYGQWVHVSVTKEDSNVNLYLNGILAGSGVLTGLESNGALRIGAYKDNTHASYCGYMDDLRFYDIALSGSEIVNIFMENINPVALYELDDIGANGEVYNSIENSIEDDGAVSLNTSLELGMFGDAVRLNGGDDDYITVPNLIDTAKDFSIFTWVYLEDTADSKAQPIIQQLDGNNGVSGDSFIYRHSTGYLRSIFDGTGLVTDYYVSYNKWHYIGITYHNSELALYANGQVIGTVSGLSPEYCDGGFRIGAYKYGPGNSTWDNAVDRWRGLVDDVKFYQCCLPEEFVLVSYDNCFSLQNSYAFDDYSEFLVRDCTGGIAAELNGGQISNVSVLGTIRGGDNTGSIYGCERSGYVDEDTCESSVVISSYTEQPDSDNDGIIDYWEDIIGTDKEEANENLDYDGDGLPDWFESYFGDNIIGMQPYADDDGDGINNITEYYMLINPIDSDSDGDYLLDGEELLYGCKPFEKDSDNDGLEDYYDVQGKARPFVYSFEEYQNFASNVDLEDRNGNLYDYVHKLLDFAEEYDYGEDWFEVVRSISYNNRWQYLTELEDSGYLDELNDFSVGGNGVNCYLNSYNMKSVELDDAETPKADDDGKLVLSYIDLFSQKFTNTIGVSLDYSWINLGIDRALLYENKSLVMNDVIKLSLASAYLPNSYSEIFSCEFSVEFSCDGTDIAGFEVSNDTLSYCNEGNWISVSDTDLIDTFYDYLDECEKNKYRDSDGNICGQYGCSNLNKLWVDLEFHFDWENFTYDVYYRNANSGTMVTLVEDAILNSDEIDLMAIKNKADSGSSLSINRIAGCDESQPGDNGGEYGTDCNIYFPEDVDVTNVSGSLDLKGDIWYAKTGLYRFWAVGKGAELGEVFPDESFSEIDLRSEVAAGAFQMGILQDATWNTFTCSNGNYDIYFELLDDNMNQVSYNYVGNVTVNNVGSNDAYSFEDAPDVVVEWPGSFPIEIKRQYSTLLADNPVPLGYGWTHNHQIILSETCNEDNVIHFDNTETVAYDSSYLAIGQIFLQQGTSFRVFNVNSIESSSGTVTYEASDNGGDYVIREHISGSDSISYRLHRRDGIEMDFEAVVVDDDNVIVTNEGARVGWNARDGIKHMRDRFGNELTYTWDEENLCVLEIANNRNDAVVQFQLCKEGYPFYVGVKVGELVQNSLTNVIMKETYQIKSGPICWADDQYETSIRGYADFYFGTNGGDNAGNSSESGFGRFCYDPDSHCMIYNYSLVTHYEGGSGITIDYNNDNSVSEIFNCKVRSTSPWTWENDRRCVSTSVKKYNTFGINGTRINVDSYRLYLPEDCDSGEYVEYKKVKTYLDKNGIPQKSIMLTTLNSDSDVELDDYNSICDIASDVKSVVSLGRGPTASNRLIVYAMSNDQEEYQFGNPIMLDHKDYLDNNDLYKMLYKKAGAITNYYYSYNDYRFPYKATEIVVEYKDDSDDKVIKIAYDYDEWGNILSQRNYVDDTYYTMTEYTYHPDYNFKTSETTWNDYCYGDDTVITPENGKSEKIWVYGNKDGVINENGKFLVQEKQLLDQGLNNYSIANYIYNDNGKPTAVQDAEGNYTYIKYDNDNGSVMAKWSGLESPSEPGSDVLPQYRSYYNNLGQLLLEVDNLGKVTRHEYGIHYQHQTKIYYDETLIQSDLTAAIYDILDYEDSYDYYLNPDGFRSVYGEYLHQEYGKPVLMLDEKGYHVKYYEYGTRSSYSEFGFKCKNPYAFLDSIMNSFVDHWNSSCWHIQWGQALVQGYGFAGAVMDLDFYSSVGPFKASAFNKIGGTAYYTVECRGGLNEASKFIYSAIDSNDRITDRYTGNLPLYGTEVTEDLLIAAKITKHEQFEYTVTGQLKSEKIFNVSEDMESAELEKYTKYYYDALDQLIRQENMLDENTVGQTICYGYDTLGHKLYEIDPSGYARITDYDNAGRVVREYYPYEVTGNFDLSAARAEAIVKKEIIYDNNSNVLQSLTYDVDGETLLAGSEYEYDTRGRVEQTVEYIESEINGSGDLEITSSSTTNIQYSDTGNSFSSTDGDLYHVCITDGEGKDTLIKLHPQGKSSKVMYSSGDYEEMDYDGYGRMISKAVWTDGVKDEISYEYDNSGNLERTRYPDGGYIQYQYDDMEKLDGEEGHYAALTNNTVKMIFDCRSIADNPYDYLNDPNFNYSGHEEDIIWSVDPNEPHIAAPVYSFEYYPYNGKLKSYTMPDGIKVNYAYNEAYGSKTNVWVQKDDQTIYSQTYSYNLLGQLENIYYGGDPEIAISDPNFIGDPTAQGDILAGIYYDANGNRQYMYYDQIDTGSDPFCMEYGYNNRNELMDIDSPVYTLGVGNIDGLGRIRSCSEVLTQNSHDYQYDYDMRSQMTWNKATGIYNENWIEESIIYDLAGNIETSSKRAASDEDNYIDTALNYTGDILSGSSCNCNDLMNPIYYYEQGNLNYSLSNDLNGNITSLATSLSNTVEYNYDNKLRYAEKGSSTISVKYDPLGNRIFKSSIVNGVRKDQRFIVDINSELPVVLCVLDGDEQDLNASTLEKSYYHLGAQIIAQQGAEAESELYYYVHDRLGSVREVIDTSMLTINQYCYDSFGRMYEPECFEATDSGTGELILENPFKYAGQYFDEEIGQYYVRARQYDPVMRRFTGRDPNRGSFEQTMSLHRYLYCWNNPINLVDLNGRQPQVIAFVVGAGAGGLLYWLTTDTFDTSDFIGSMVAGGIITSLATLGLANAEFADFALGQIFFGIFEATAIGLLGYEAGKLTSYLIDSIFDKTNGFGAASSFLKHGDGIGSSAYGVYVTGDNIDADAVGESWCDAWTDGAFS